MSDGEMGRKWGEEDDEEEIIGENVGKRGETEEIRVGKLIDENFFKEEKEWKEEIWEINLGCEKERFGEFDWIMVEIGEIRRWNEEEK